MNDSSKYEIKIIIIIQFINFLYTKKLLILKHFILQDAIIRNTNINKKNCFSIIFTSFYKNENCYYEYFIYCASKNKKKCLNKKLLKLNKIDFVIYFIT